MQKNITICADDYGMSQDINNAVKTLLKKKTINATSCMANMPYFTDGLVSLKELKNILSKSIQVGLHLNLTEGKPLSNYSDTGTNGKFHKLSNLLIKSHLKRLNYQDVYLELKAQLSVFIENWGGLPDFLDGHQHIHHFPIIRKAVITLYKEFDLYQNNTYIRSVRNIKRSDIKSQIIYCSGAKKFEFMLKNENIIYNSSFSGIYSLDSDNTNFRDIMLKAYVSIKSNGIIMCHPSKILNEKDPIGNARVKEYLYFNSEKAIQDQLNNQITLL